MFFSEVNSVKHNREGRIQGDEKLDLLDENEKALYYMNYQNSGNDGSEVIEQTDLTTFKQTPFGRGNNNKPLPDYLWITNVKPINENLSTHKFVKNTFGNVVTGVKTYKNSHITSSSTYFQRNDIIASLDIDETERLLDVIVKTAGSNVLSFLTKTKCSAVSTI